MAADRDVDLLVGAVPMPADRRSLRHLDQVDEADRRVGAVALEDAFGEHGAEAAVGDRLLEGGDVESEDEPALRGAGARVEARVEASVKAGVEGRVDAHRALLLGRIASRATRRAKRADPNV